MKQVIEWKKIENKKIPDGKTGVFLFGRYEDGYIFNVMEGDYVYYDGGHAYVTPTECVTVKISLAEFTHYAEIGEVEE